MNKYQRYRARLRAEVKCTHCGKLCAPYFECDDRREYKNRRHIRKKITKPSDRRLLPRGKRRLWTDKEDAILRSMLASDAPLAAICARLNRSPLGVLARARKLDLTYFRGCDELASIASLLA